MSHRLRIVPPVYLVVGMFGMSLLNKNLPIVRLIPEPYSRAGYVLMTVAMLALLWSWSAFGIKRTTVNPFKKSTALVTQGPYRVTRNPMYLGLVLVLLAYGVIMGSLSPFFVLPVFVWVIQTQFIVHEEAILEETFGNEFRHYKKKVRRWI